MLHSIRASRWLRPALLLIILGFCSYGLAQEWPQVHPALAQLNWYSVALSIGCAMAGASQVARLGAILEDLFETYGVPPN